MRIRPMFHSYDAAIRGHVYCSFLRLGEGHREPAPTSPFVWPIRA
jgi:hypothetical protein